MLHTCGLEFESFYNHWGITLRINQHKGSLDWTAASCQSSLTASWPGFFKTLEFYWRDETLEYSSEMYSPSESAV